MEGSVGVQQLFFQHIKTHLPPHLSLVDEVADLLDISNDSAYRRIRGEKTISFDEVRTLCAHFRVSLDQLFHLQTDTLLFEGKFINQSNFDFDGYLQELLQLLLYTNSFEKKEIFFTSKDLSIFHLFNFPELAAFKAFFWMKTILNYPSHGKKRFAADEFPPATQSICTKIIEIYNGIPSQEIWHVDCIDATIRQIEYYKDTKLFASDRDLAAIYEGLQRTVDHIETQAEQGRKFSLAPAKAKEGASFKLFINEFVVGDNSYLVELGDSRMVVLNHAVLNTVRTKDPHFAQCTADHFQNIIRRSTSISGVGEKDRSKFFNALRDKIDASRQLHRAGPISDKGPDLR